MRLQWNCRDKFMANWTITQDAGVQHNEKNLSRKYCWVYSKGKVTPSITIFEAILSEYIELIIHGIANC